MNVSIAPQLEAYIQKKVASGRYSSASEVVREALRLLEERDRINELRLDDLRRELAVGLEQLERGEFSDYEAAGLKEFFSRIKEAGLARPTGERADRA